MSARFSILILENSPARWENAEEKIGNLPGAYVYFASETEQIDPERITGMLSGVSRSAELIVPAAHTRYPSDETLEEPLLLPFRNICSRFRCIPLLNGKLMKKKTLLESIRKNPHDWLHSPCPDLFLLLFCNVMTSIARTNYVHDNDSFIWIAKQLPESRKRLAALPGIGEADRSAILSRLAQFEDHLTDCAAALDFPDEKILELFGGPTVIHNYYTKHPEKLYRLRLPEAKSKPGKIRSLAVFCAGLRGGGAERCASLLLKQFSDRTDWKIYLFQNSPSEPGDYPCPENVEIIVLPTVFYDRYVRLSSLLKAKSIDTCLFFDHFLANFYYDILTSVQLGIRTIAMEHNTFSFPLFSGNPELMALRQAVYPAADIVTCLSRSDELIWNQFGINARYMPNPLTFDTSERPAFKERDSKTLIFIARLTPGKGVLDALKTVEIVRQKHPEVKLFVLGKFPDPAFEQEMHAYVKAHHLTDNVRFTGFAKVEDYIPQASVHLMPSCVEGYPMTLMEAKSAGVPTVSYSLPYLEAGKAEYGTVMVPQQDYRAMAEKVSELFDDFRQLNVLARKAWDCLPLFDNHMVSARWKQLFDWLETGGDPIPIPARDAGEQLKIQVKEIVSGISFMQNSVPFRQKILNSEIAVRRDDNILFGSLFRVYFSLRKGVSNRAFLRAVLHFLFGCLWRMKRMYRIIRPWQDEEQDL